MVEFAAQMRDRLRRLRQERRYLRKRCAEYRGRSVLGDSGYTPYAGIGFETADERYAWLNRVFALGKGRVLGPTEEAPMGAKWVAALVLASWCIVIMGGRLLPYI